jgi:hypothetical protein
MLRVVTEARTDFFLHFFFDFGLFSICLGGIGGDARATSGVCAQWAGASRSTSAPLQLTPDARGGAVEVVADEVAKRFVILLYVSSYCYICVLTLLYMCPHTAIYVSSYCNTCVRVEVFADEMAKRFVMHVLVLLDVPPHTAI